MHVYFNGNYFIQNKVVIPNNKNLINIYCVYQLDPISSSRDTTYTIENALFGAAQITKNADTSKYKYKGYGICFDEGGTFNKRNITNGRNVIICGVHESSLIHSSNKANNILLWAIFLCKESTTRHFMQIKYRVKILLNQVKSSY